MKLPERLASLAEKIRPLRDNVCVKRFEYEHPTLYVAGVRLNKGVVVAVGPGRRIRRKTRFDLMADGVNTTRSLWFEDGEETGQVRPMRVKVGDVVEFSHTVGSRTGKAFELDGEELLMMGEQSIIGKTNDSRAEALLWSQSAGFDRHGRFMSGTESWQKA